MLYNICYILSYIACYITYNITCYITKSECYITILEMLYNNCYITHVIKHDKYKVI